MDDCIFIQVNQEIHSKGLRICLTCITDLPQFKGKLKTYLFRNGIWHVIALLLSLFFFFSFIGFLLGFLLKDFFFLFVFLLLFI